MRTDDRYWLNPKHLNPQTTFFMPDTTHFVMATAGHVDHGKSSLVLALTGTDPDRLPEEKARGLTIELGFASLELATATHTFVVGIVDVPGHEDFVKNMVAGVGCIDLALFTVAADDGWMPQTEEHLQILSYIGVQHAVVAMTKIDLVDTQRIDAVQTDIRERLKDTPFAEAAIVGTAAPTAVGIDKLREALTNVLWSTPSPRDIGKPRLAVDRTFSIPGAGTIVTGTLTGGYMKQGDPALIMPSGCKSRIRSLQSHNAKAELIGPGTRAALNLADVAANEDVNRGDVVTIGTFGKPSTTIDVHLNMSIRIIECVIAQPLKDETRVHFHHGSSHVPARVYLLETRVLEPGDMSFAQIRTESPVFVAAGDHFVVRDWSERVTLAGGRIINPVAQRKELRSHERRTYLQICTIGHPKGFAHGAIFLHGKFELSGFLSQSRFATNEIDAAMDELLADGEIVQHAGFAISATLWQDTLIGLAATVDKCHQEHPERDGLELTELRRAVPVQLDENEIFKALVAAVCSEGFAQIGNMLCRKSHQSALPAALQATGDAIRKALTEKPFEPPSRNDLMQLPKAEQVIRFLIDAGEAVQISPELLFAAQAYAEAQECVRRHITDNGPATVSELKSAIGTTRRVMVPLAERLDRDRFTVRVGDKRKLGK
jgi:selenocysteine-specific elongation factor